MWPGRGHLLIGLILLLSIFLLPYVLFLYDVLLGLDAESVWLSLWFFRVLAHVTYAAMLVYVLIVGEAHSLKVEKVLFKDNSDFQEILVFEV